MPEDAPTLPHCCAESLLWRNIARDASARLVELEAELARLRAILERGPVEVRGFPQERGKA